MGQKFEIDPVPRGAMAGPAKWSKDTDAEGLVKDVDFAARSLAGVGRRMNDIETSDAGSFLVAGAVHGFFRDRSEAIVKAAERAQRACAGTSEAMAAIDAGDEEMAATVLSNARHVEASR